MKRHTRPKWWNQLAESRLRIWTPGIDLGGQPSDSEIIASGVTRAELVVARRNAERLVRRWLAVEGIQPVGGQVVLDADRLRRLAEFVEAADR